jgi:predicted secreted protein
MHSDRFSLRAGYVIAAVLGLLCSVSVKAQSEPVPPHQPPQGVVSLSASASADVAKDVLAVALSASKEGLDARSVQALLKTALDAALIESRKVVKPGQLDVQTGVFSLYPRYSNKGSLNGWQGQAELLIEGRDMPAIAALAGRISTMTVARVSHELSRELREKTEGELTTQAITRYRAKAADMTKQFGYSSYVIREVSVNTGESSAMENVVPMMMRAKAADMASEPLPVAPSKGVVSVSVNGSVQLKR